MAGRKIGRKDRVLFNLSTWRAVVTRVSASRYTIKIYRPEDEEKPRGSCTWDYGSGDSGWRVFNNTVQFKRSCAGAHAQMILNEAHTALSKGRNKDSVTFWPGHFGETETKAA